MLDAFLHAARTSKEWDFVWHRVRQYARRLLHEASPRALILVSPHIRWEWLTDRDDLVQRWAAAASASPYTEKVAQSVVDTLLQIASEELLLPRIPVNIWSWLTKRPPLPPVCLGRHVGTRAHVINVVRAFKDIEVLKSYFLLIWSEWNIPGCLLPDHGLIHLRSGRVPIRLRFGRMSIHLRFGRTPIRRPRYGFDGFSDMRISIQEDFGGIGMKHHREGLLQHLDHVLGQLDRGLEYLKQHNPKFDEANLQGAKDQYQNLRETLLLEMIGRTSYLTITPLRMLTPAHARRISHNVHVCTPSSVPVASRLERLVLPLPLRSHLCVNITRPTAFFSLFPSSLTCRGGLRFGHPKRVTRRDSRRGFIATSTHSPTIYPHLPRTTKNDFLLDVDVFTYYSFASTIADCTLHLVRIHDVPYLSILLCRQGVNREPRGRFRWMYSRGGVVHKQLHRGGNACEGRRWYVRSRSRTGRGMNTPRDKSA